MLTYDQALELILAEVVTLSQERVPLLDAANRVLAQSPIARWDLPESDRSMMDGYAFQFSSQTAGSVLQEAGEVFAGHPVDRAVKAGASVRIMTGANLPPGCDTVVPIEEIERSAGQIRLKAVPTAGQFVRKRAEEIEQGMPLLAPGRLLDAGAIGLLVAGGVETVCVHRRPRVAILSTGDELVPHGQRPGPGQLVNSNQPLLTVRLRELGADPLPLGIASDEMPALNQALEQLEGVDVLLTTGGVSVGDRDLVMDALLEKGFQKIFWKVQVKPGKPLLFGRLGQTLVFGLPGNPAATATTAELFVAPALRRMSGLRHCQAPRLPVRLTDTARGDAKRLTFLPGQLDYRDGSYRFTPHRGINSGQHRGYAETRALLPIPAGVELPADTEVELLLLGMPLAGEPALFGHRGASDA